MSTVGSLAIVAGLATSVVAVTARPVAGVEARDGAVKSSPAAAQTAAGATTGRSELARFRATRHELKVASNPPMAARTMVAKVNRERTARGLRAYRYSPQLSTVALRWAHQMGRSQKLKHNPRLTNQVRGYRFVGENVGYGPSLSRTHAAFMKSPGHRANVLDRDYNQIGMAVVKDSKGRYWIVEVFRDPR